MCRRRNVILWALSLVLPLALPAAAQGPTHALAPALDAGGRRAIVEEFARAMRDHYIFTERAEQVAKRTTDALASGKYDDARTAGELAARLSAETMTPLRATDLLIFSIVGNRFHQGSVRWVRGPKFGIDLVDALDILSCSDAVDPGFLASHASRSKRYPVDLTGRIAIGSICYHSTVRDVSRSGMRLEIDAVLEVGQQVIVRLPDRPLILASRRPSSKWK